MLSFLSEEASPPLCNFAILLFPPISVPSTPPLNSPLPGPFCHSVWLLLVHRSPSIFLSLHIFPFSDIQLESWSGRDYCPSKKDEIVLTSWKFSECTKYKGLPLLFFSKFFTSSSVLLPSVITVSHRKRCWKSDVTRICAITSSLVMQFITGTSRSKVLLTSAVWIRGDARIYWVVGIAQSYGELGSASPVWSGAMFLVGSRCKAPGQGSGG